jgi:hypothetical protein
VRVSLRGPLIRYSDPNWVDTLRRGINLIIFGVIATILGVFVAAFLSVGGSPLLAMVLMFGADLLIVAGSWLLTAPDPSGIGEDAYGVSRKVIRITLIIRVVNNLTSFLERTGGIDPGIRQMLVAVGAIAQIAGVVGFVAMLNYLGKLADRIPDDYLSARANFLKWAIGTCYVIVIGFGAVAALAVRSAGKPSAALGSVIGLGCIVMIAGIALLVFGIMYLFFLDKLNKQLREQSELAKRSWNTATAAAVR